MDDTEDRDHDDRIRCDYEGPEIHRREAVDRHDDGTNRELDQRTVVGIDTLQELVEDDHPGVEYRGHDSADQSVGVEGFALIQHSGDQYESEQRQERADQIDPSQFDPEHQWGHQDDHRRGHVVTHDGHGDLDGLVGLEQEQPVQPQADP